MIKTDLHTHTNYSDGTLEPLELVEKAHELGITHLAICDHDSTGGIEPARKRAKELEMTIIPGIEINTKETISMHLLGYFIEEASEALQKSLQTNRKARMTRAQRILDKLHRMGIKISLSDFDIKKDGAAIGRPHIADKLREKGIVFSRQEAFDKYLAQGRPAYVLYEGPNPVEAIQAILAAKGVPVLAHPGYSVSRETIELLVKNGLQGIEAFYPSHHPDQVRAFVELAKRLDLVVTGGSDYHGPGTGHERLGEIEIPAETLDILLERKKKIF